MYVSLSNLNPINSHGLNVKSQKSSQNVTKTNVASSYNSSKVNQAILNNLSFTGGVVSKEIVEMAQKKYKEFCDAGKKHGNYAKNINLICHFEMLQNAWGVQIMKQ